MSQLNLFKSRRFLPLFLTQFLGAFNDNFFKNALVLLVTYKTSKVLGIPSSQTVVVAGGIFILPFFLFSALAGQIADKFEKTALIRIVKLAEIAIMGIAAVGFLTGQYGLLLFVLFLMGLHSTVFGPIKFSILPQLLTKDELVGGNALVEAGTFLAILLGTIGGGVLIAHEPSGPLIVSAALLILAFLGWVTSRGIPEAPPVDPGLRISWEPFTPTWQILKFSKESRSVFLSILGISWFWFFGGAFLSLFPVYCKEFLKAEQGVVTLFLSLFSIGIAIGSLICEWVSRERLELGIVPLGSFGMSFFALDLFLVGVPDLGVAPVSVSAFLHHSGGIRIALDLLLLSIFSGLYIVPLNTMIQTRSRPSHRSRIIAANNILNALFMVMASLLLLGMITVKASVPAIFLTLSLMNVAVALYIYLLLPEFFLRFLVWGLANVFYRVKVINHGNIPHDGPAVLVCNHVSFIDWLILSAAVKRPVRFVMDAGFNKGFFRSTLLRHAKVIPIATAKENPEILKAAFEKVAEELRNGELVCIFPEGKLTRTGDLSPFKPGVERIIRETPVPVIPMAISNLWGSLFSREGGKGLLKKPKKLFARIVVTIGEPVPASEVTAALLENQVKTLRGNAA